MIIVYAHRNDDRDNAVIVFDERESLHVPEDGRSIKTSSRRNGSILLCTRTSRSNYLQRTKTLRPSLGLHWTVLRRGKSVDPEQPSSKADTFYDDLFRTRSDTVLLEYGQRPLLSRLWEFLCLRAEKSGYSDYGSTTCAQSCDQPRKICF